MSKNVENVIKVSEGSLSNRYLTLCALEKKQLLHILMFIKMLQCLLKYGLSNFILKLTGQN